MTRGWCVAVLRLQCLGPRLVTGAVDEDSPSSDAEVFAAAMPSLSMTPGGGS